MKKHSSDIIIIGAGAAGLMAAAGAAETLGKNAGGSVTVLEKMPRPGRKIMLTGKGRCNFTNAKPWNEFSGHIHPKPNFLKPAFHNLTSERMIAYLQDHGMEAIVERGDRAFPASHLASDVVDTLVRAATDSGAEIHCGKTVESISGYDQASVQNESGPQEKETSIYEIRCTDGTVYTCMKLIVCTGGLSYPKTGSTGDGYAWAMEAGHSIRQLFPSLTAIVPKGYKDDSANPDQAKNKASKGHIDRSLPLSEIGESLCGNQLKNVNLSIIIDGNMAQEEFGDLDFTDGGIEGPIGFKVSRKCVNAIMNGSKVAAVLDLKPAVDSEDLSVRISRLWDEVSKDRRHSGKQYKERFRIMLGNLLPSSLIPAFIRLNPNADHKTLARLLKNWKFDIAGYVGYERCVITAGGVSLDEVTAKTLESKVVPGLYFAGEVLDLDADTGGYNLQIAFSTGYLAGISAAKAIR